MPTQPPAAFGFGFRISASIPTGLTQKYDEAKKISFANPHQASHVGVGLKRGLGSMAGLAEIASAMICSAQRRIDVSAQNVSNMSTPGYRARRVFATVLDQIDALPADAVAATGADNLPLKETGSALDLASDPGSVFIFRDGAAFYASRSAQLRRDADGRLLDSAGGLLQSYGGGDVSIGSDTPEILRDGTVLVDGQPEARIGLFVNSGHQTGGALASFPFIDSVSSLPGEAASGTVHQGMVVPSNVDLGTEMTELSRASRQSETGARVFQIYDDLLGRAATKLAEIGA